MPDLGDLDGDVVEQQKWGMDRSMLAIQRIARLLRGAANRLQALEDRVTALEQRLPPP
jgi:hypothetical protein